MSKYIVENLPRTRILSFAKLRKLLGFKHEERYWLVRISQQLSSGGYIHFNAEELDHPIKVVENLGIYGFKIVPLSKLESALLEMKSNES